MKLIDYIVGPQLTILWILLSTVGCLNQVEQKEPPILTGTPTISDESVQMAIEAFSIKAPKTCLPIKINKDATTYRGITERRAWWDSAKVTLGAPAFSSWAILGSTLAHEIEAHCAQPFAIFHALDAIHSDLGTSLAEVLAYNIEAKQKDRFNLSESEVHEVESYRILYLSQLPDWAISALKLVGEF